MSQVILELSNREDLTLLLSFAKRLNVHIVSVKSQVPSQTQTADRRRALLQQAANDPLFLADIAEIADDFKHVER